MGVPKFYRWISERYPCLSEVVKEFQLPEFDNLYLDMNGVVHVCSHPEDDNPHFRITEEQIFKDICHYIEFLFRMIKPKQVFFMAIDGVAPRAKMNQQRGRRFRSAREAEDLIKQAKERGEKLPTEKRFDSNCITPGTVFMQRLQNHLKYFVTSKVTNDPLWQGPKIILSGHETPGEGEHKVMDFIRYSRSQPGYDPNTRHCLYGLDADLIMLGLTSHEPHFALLREEVRFGGKKSQKRPATPEETTFHLLHLSLMREYLDYEFSSLKSKLPFEYNLENVIDDWVLMGFLVGNDFIPHLPHLHIHHDALPLLWQTYMEVLPSLDGYLNEGGHLNLRRFEKYIGALTPFDREQFSEQYMDVKYLEGKRGGRQTAQASGGGGSRNGPGQRNKKTVGNNAFAALQGLDNMDVEFEEDGRENGLLEAHLASQGLHMGDVDSDEDFDTFDAEFSAHKRNYYMTKMHYENVTPEVLREQAFEYVRAIQWILLYYYEGVQSWSWYYPHHYAPYVSDVRDFSHMELRYDMSEPFRPFEQLMAVLPAASKELLPAPLQELMIDESSPVLDYYPVNFSTDLNGKQQDWEAVVLIPFIDERRLLSAISSKEHLLSGEERQRNSHGPCYMYQHSEELQGFYPSSVPGAFPDIAVNHAKVTAVPKFHFCLEPARICKGLMGDTLLNVYYPGFPTLQHIPHVHRLEKCGVKVFQANSRGFSMMLSVLDLPERSLEDLASEMLGQTTWVGWPHMHEAKVFAIADERFKIEIEEQHKKGQSAPVVQWSKKQVQRAELERVYKEAQTIKEKYHDRFGVEVGKTSVLIYAGPMTGRKYVYTSHGRITTEKQFSTNTLPYALQTTCKDILSHLSDDMHLRTMEDLFPVNAPAFMMGNPHYGCQGEVLEVDNQEGRVRVSFNVLEEPDLSLVYKGRNLEGMDYMPGHVAAQRLGLSNHMLSRITGTVLILRGDGGNAESRANIGLNLKFTKRGEEVPGYTRKTTGGWLYSEKCVDVIGNYLNEFAELWEYIASSQTGNSDLYTEVELFPKEGEKTLKDALKYLAELPCTKVQSMKTGAHILSDALVLTIELAVDAVVEVNKKKQKKVKMQVKPHLLFRPLPNQGTLEPDPGTTFEMLDRVVVVKMGYSVPFGLRGTVVGIHPGDTAMDTMYDVLFDQEFVGGIILRSTTKRGYRVPAVAMLSLTHGARKNGRQQQKQQQQQQQPPVSAWNSRPSQQQQQSPRPGLGFQGNWHQGQGHSSYANLVRQEGGGRPGPRGGGGFGMMPPRPDQWTGQGFAQQAPLQPPTFVTPKFNTSPPKPARGIPMSQPAIPAADTGDFTSIWNQLLQSNTAGMGGAPASKASQPSTATTGGGAVPNRNSHSARTGREQNQHQGAASKRESSSSPVSGGFSLQSAAEKLGKIAPPTCDLMEVSSVGNPPTGILVDLSEPGESLGGSTARHSWQERSQPSHEQEIKKTKTRVFTNSNHNHHQARVKDEGKEPSSGKSNPSSVLALFEKASKARDEQRKSPSQPAHTDKVKALFEQVQKPTSVGGGDPASSEFNALFAALQAAPKSVSPSAEDGSAALRQMLKIGVEDSTGTADQGGKKSYGRQVSVQELFDGAKQAPSSSQSETQQADAAPASAPPPSSSSSSAQQGVTVSSDQHHHHQQQSQQQAMVGGAARPPHSMANPLLPPPSLLGSPGQQSRNMGRKPVDELATFCQAMGKPMPKYDFSVQTGKQKGFICQVTLPGGARFEGSLSHSQQDAAESAASMAMLCLNQMQMGFPAQGMGASWITQTRASMRGGGVRPAQPLFSPNSAFSPVANPLMRFAPPVFSQPPPALLLPQQGRQPLLSQPPPPFANRGGGGPPYPHSSLPTTSHPPPPLVGVPFTQSLPRPMVMAMTMTTASHNAATAGVADPRHPAAANQAAGGGGGGGGEDRGWEGLGGLSVKSSTEAFIPLQVTQKHRRKEETPEKHPPPSSTAHSTDQQHRQTAPSGQGSKSHSLSPAPLDSVSTNSHHSSTTPNMDSAHQAVTIHGAGDRKSSSSEKKKGQQRKDDGCTEGGKRRRPRMAANFAMGPK